MRNGYSSRCNLLSINATWPGSLGELMLEVEINIPTTISAPLKPDMEPVHHIACPHLPSVRKKNWIIFPKMAFLGL